MNETVVDNKIDSVLADIDILIEWANRDLSLTNNKENKWYNILEWADRLTEARDLIRLYRPS